MKKVAISIAILLFGLQTSFADLKTRFDEFSNTTYVTSPKYLLKSNNTSFLNKYSGYLSFWYTYEGKKHTVPDVIQFNIEVPNVAMKSNVQHSDEDTKTIVFFLKNGLLKRFDADCNYIFDKQVEDSYYHNYECSITSDDLDRFVYLFYANELKIKTGIFEFLIDQADVIKIRDDLTKISSNYTEEYFDFRKLSPKLMNGQ